MEEGETIAGAAQYEGMCFIFKGLDGRASRGRVGTSQDETDWTGGQVVAGRDKAVTRMMLGPTLRPMGDHASALRVYEEY